MGVTYLSSCAAVEAISDGIASAEVAASTRATVFVKKNCMVER